MSCTRSVWVSSKDYEETQPPHRHAGVEDMAMTLVRRLVIISSAALCVAWPGTFAPSSGPLEATAAAQPLVAPTGAVVGSPSPRNANYSIDVRLDAERRALTGREVLTWRNVSSVSTAELQFHLYYNAWKNTRSTWMQENRLGRGSALEGRPAEDWGWIDVTAVRLLGAGDAPPIDLTDRVHHIAPDDGNPDDETVLAVPLPQRVQPGDTVNLEIEWASRVPRTFARTGAIGDYFFLAQWFPKIGVLEDSGWNTHQFHTATEFFSDYGVYDVRLTVPAGWVVGATGVEVDVRDNGDGTATHQYYQEDVHDFAWTTSPDVLDLWDTFTHPNLPDVQIRLLLQPEHEEQAARYFEATRLTLESYGEWFGAYPYDHLTIVDPAWQSGSGGMEYPTLFTGGARWLAPDDIAQPESVTIHEAGHQFWYGVVGNNEFEHAWLDEGLTTFATARVLDESFSPHYRSIRLFGGFVPWVIRDVPWSRVVDGDRVTGYRRDARQDQQSTPTFRYWPGTAVSISYDKTALWLHTLERYLGWTSLRQGMSAFYDRWRFAHPTPNDFFNAISTASGEDLDWFFDQVHGGANVYDYGIAQLTSRPVGGRGFFGGDSPTFSESSETGSFETTVVVRRHGDATFPVEVVTEFSDGTEERAMWDGTGRWTAFRYETESRALRAFVDPDHVLLMDTHVTNNSRTLAPMADRAATKWSLTWLVWLQDVLLTYGFFI